MDRENNQAAHSVKLSGFVRTRPYTILPKIMLDNNGHAIVWSDSGQAYITVYRSAFEGRATDSIETVEQTVTPLTIGNGNTLRRPRA